MPSTGPGASNGCLLLRGSGEPAFTEEGIDAIARFRRLPSSPILSKDGKLRGADAGVIVGGNGEGPRGPRGRRSPERDSGREILRASSQVSASSSSASVVAVDPWLCDSPTSVSVRVVARRDCGGSSA